MRERTLAVHREPFRVCEGGIEQAAWAFAWPTSTTIPNPTIVLLDTFGGLFQRVSAGHCPFMVDTPT